MVYGAYHTAAGDARAPRPTPRYQGELGAVGCFVGEVGADVVLLAVVEAGAFDVHVFVDLVNGGGVDGVHAHFDDVAVEGAGIGAVLPGAVVDEFGAGGDVVVAFAVGTVVGASGGLVDGGVLIGIIDVVGDVDAG